jgi:signal transduction histidine kinase
MGEDLYALNEPYIRAALSGERQTFERTLTKASGEVRHTLANYVPHVVAGSVAGFLATVIDVTELTQAHESLRESHAALEQTALAQRQFIYIASHDLREPVNTMTSFARLLSEDYGSRLDDTARRYLDHVQGSAERMAALLDDLTSYVRLEQVDAPFAPVALDVVAAAVREDLTDLLARRRARLVTGPLPVVEGQESLLRMLLQNLVDNASKFQEPQARPQVELRQVERADSYEIVCIDNGIGIPDSHLDRVFDLFHRLHPYRRYPGTGIGLALCRRIVELHRGQIWAEPLTGGGTAIHVRLPRPAGTA